VQGVGLRYIPVTISQLLSAATILYAGSLAGLVERRTLNYLQVSAVAHHRLLIVYILLIVQRWFQRIGPHAIGRQDCRVACAVSFVIPPVVVGFVLRCQACHCTACSLPNAASSKPTFCSRCAVGRHVFRACQNRALWVIYVCSTRRHRAQFTMSDHRSGLFQHAVGQHFYDTRKHNAH
jgi:hypothetical protein